MFYFAGEPEKHAGLAYQQKVKEKNIKRIFDFLRSGECESRAELVRAMELSATSVSALVEELESRKFLKESGLKRTAQPGRRPVRLKFNENAKHIVTFTISRRGICYTLLNLRCKVLESLSLKCEPAICVDGDAGPYYAERFLDILNNHARMFDPDRTICVGISIPGLYRPATQVFSMKTSIGLQFSRQSMVDFERQLGIRVCLVNTTVCQGYAEKKHLDNARKGAGQVRDMIYVHVNDGVGASIIYNGDIYSGSFNTAGEIGHMSIDFRGRPCACGNRGCLERYVSLDAILDDARKTCLAEGIDPPETFDAFSTRYPESPAMAKVVRDAAEYLACGIHNMMCATGIQRIVLGGGVEILGEPFLESLRESVQIRSALFCDNLNLTYAGVGSGADGEGFAHCFLDKVYTITY